MSSAINVALSGLAAEARRLGVSAGNVANMRSAGVDPAASAAAGQAVSTGGGPAFVPHRTMNVSQAGGGVSAVAVPIDPASVALFDPGDPAADSRGLVYRPNVSLEQELVTQTMALRSFQANLKTIEVQDEMLGDLLDLLS